MPQIETIETISRKVNAGQLKPRQLVEAALEKARAAADLNLFTEIFDEAALEAANRLAKRLASGRPAGRLAGVVFCAKDNFLLRGSKTTAAAPFLLDFIAPYTASCLKKLLDEDAILIGKTNLDAFAHGTSTENSCFGPSRNPHDSRLTPGGSSGGSAAAVAAGVCPFSLGTDTGGSVRLPAAFCGVFGYKPTYGLLSRSGVVAMASSTDCVSPLTRSAEDAAYLLDILKGRDEADGTTFESAGSRLGAGSLKRPPRIGLIAEFADNLAPEVETAFRSAIKSFEAAGWQIERTSLPSLELALACYYILVPAEISSNLGRYDGLHYGLRRSGDDWQAAVNLSRGEGFMAENKRRIMLGTYVLSRGYYESYYQKAQQLRSLICRQFDQAFAKFDALISPVSPGPAFKLGEKSRQPLEMYLADLMTVAPSLAGIPAASLPLPVSGLPVGLQVMTPPKSDGLNLDICRLMGEKL